MAKLFKAGDRAILNDNFVKEANGAFKAYSQPYYMDEAVVLGNNLPRTITYVTNDREWGAFKHKDKILWLYFEHSEIVG